MTEGSPKPAEDIEFVQIRESVLVEVRRFEQHQHRIAPRRARFPGVVRRSFRRRHPSGGCLRPASGLPACADGWSHWVPSGVIRGFGGGGTSPRGLEGHRTVRGCFQTDPMVSSRYHAQRSRGSRCRHRRIDSLSPNSSRGTPRRNSSRTRPSRSWSWEIP